MTTVYHSSADKPPELDPRDLDDVKPVIFDWSDVLADGAAQFTAQQWSANSPNVVIGDGVQTVTRAGQILTPPAPQWLLNQGGQWVSEPIATARGTGVYVWFTAPGLYRLQCEIAMDNESALPRSVMLRVVTTK